MLTVTELGTWIEISKNRLKKWSGEMEEEKEHGENREETKKRKIWWKKKVDIWIEKRVCQKEKEEALHKT